MGLNTIHFKNHTTGVILAGGQGARVGYRNKGLLNWHGSPLFAHAARTLLPQVHQLFIVANRDGHAYAGHGGTVISDALSEYVAPGSGGPLFGVLAAMQAACTPYIAVTPCDSPQLPADFVARLHDHCERHEARPVVLQTPSGMQYLHCLLSTSLLPELRAYLFSGQRSVRGFLSASHAVSCPMEHEILNLNTTEAFAHGKKLQQM